MSRIETLGISNLNNFKSLNTKELTKKIEELDGTIEEYSLLAANTSDNNLKK